MPKFEHVFISVNPLNLGKSKYLYFLLVLKIHFLVGFQIKIYIFENWGFGILTQNV